MPCKYFVDGKESKLYTELYGYFDNTAPEKKSAERVYEILRDNSILRRNDGNLYVVQGKGVSTQLKELDRINSKYPGLIDYNFIKKTEPTQYSPTNRLFGAAINESVLQSIPQDGEANADATYQTRRDIDEYMRSRETSAFAQDYQLDEMARAENTSDQSRMSQGQKDTEVRNQQKITHLKNAFSKVGIEVDVVMDPSLDVLGEVQPHEVGEPVTIKFNPDIMADDTVYHEFGHVYIDLLGTDHPAVASAIAQLKGTDLYTQVEQKYPDLQGERLDKEVLATAIGLEGAKITRKNPNPIQVLLNKIFRAFSNMLNKLGIKSTPATAATLAQEMFANELRASAMINPLSSYAQQSRGEQRLTDLVNQAKIQVESELRAIRNLPEATEEQQKAKEKALDRQEVLKVTLSNVKKVEDLSKFVAASAETISKARVEYDRLVALSKQSPEEAASPANMARMYELKKTIDAMDTIKQLKNIVRAKQRKIKKTGQARPRLDTERLANMEERIFDIIEEVEDMEYSYKKDIIPMVAAALQPFHNTKIDAALQERLDNVLEHKRWRGILKERDRRYKELEEKLADEQITQEEFEDARIELTAQQIREEMIPGRGALIRELESAYEDKSAFAFYFDPIMYSNEKSIQMLAKLIDGANIRKNERDLDFKPELNEAYTEFAKGQSEADVQRLNEDLLEEVEIDSWKDGKRQRIKVLSLVQPLDLNKARAAEREMFTTLAQKYGKPLRRDFKTEGEYDTALKKWLNNRNTVTRYNAERDAWYEKNHEPSPTWKTELAKLERAIAKQEKYKKNAQDKGKEDAVVMIETRIQQLKNIKRNNLTSTGKPRGEWSQPKESIYANKKYKKIQSNPRLKKYYDFVRKEFKVAHDLIGTSRMDKNPWDTHSYLMPTIRKKDIDRLKEQGAWKTAKDILAEATSPMETDDMFGNYNSLTGELDKKVPVYYTNVVPAKDVSRDIASSLYQFRDMAHNFAEKSDIVGQVMTAREVMQNRGVLATNSSGTVMLNSIANSLGMKLPQRKDGESWRMKHLDEFLDMALFGQKEIQAKVGKWDLSKSVNAINSFTAINNLSFNFLQGVNQGILDNMTSLQEGIAGQFFTKADLAWAKKQYWSEGAAIKDVGKFMPTTKLGKAIEFFDALTEMTDREGQRLVGSKARKLMDSGNFLFVQAAFEHEMSGTRMLAILNNTKVKDADGNAILNENGKEASLYDMLVIDEKGRMSIDPRVANVTKNEITHLIRGVARRTNQIKGSFDKGMLERRWYGKLFMLFRRYINPGIRRRFGHGEPLHVDEELGTVTQGMYRTFFNMFLEAYDKKTPNLLSIYDTMTDSEKADVKRTAVELSSIVAAAAIVAALSNLDDDEETWVSNFMLYQARRYQTEMMQWNPLFGYKDVIRMAKSPAATVRPLENGLNLAQQIFFYELPYIAGIPVDDKRIHYQRRTGRFEKGDRKIRKQVEDLLPIVRGIEKSKTPEEAFKWFNL